MLLIPCPWCGHRDETEFKYGGEAQIIRPADPDALSDAEWADYLFMRKNTKGPFLERWVHAAGCRRWFNLARDTVSNRIYGAYKIGAQPPDDFLESTEKPSAGWVVITGGAAAGVDLTAAASANATSAAETQTDSGSEATSQKVYA